MTDIIGYSTASVDANGWMNAEVIAHTKEELLEGLRKELQAVGITEEDLHAAAPLLITEVREVRQITWDDLK